MKANKLLTAIMGFLICISLIRALNNAGSINIISILQDIQEIDANYIELLLENAAEFIEAEYDYTTKYGWDNTLTGIDGLFTNLKNILVLGIMSILNSIAAIVVGLVNTLIFMIKLVLDIIKIAFRLTGIMQ